MYSAVILQSMRTKLVIPEKWVQELNLNRETKIFLSDDEEKPANFTAPIRYFLQNTDACYNGIYLKSGKHYKRISL